jgi:hypothetical protein
VEEELRKKNAKEVKRLNERTNKKMKVERESDGKVRRRILKNEKVKESRERKREMQAGSEI